MVLRRIWRRFDRTWRRTPEAAWRVWLVRLAWGWALTGGVMAALALLTRYLVETGRLAWERSLLSYLGTEFPLSFGFALLLDGLSNPVPLVLLTFALAIFALWAGRPLRALSFLAAFFCMALVVFLGWGLWDRARPTQILEGLGSPGAAFQAFPSGHMAQATAVYGLVAWLWVRASRSPAERLLVGLGAVVFLIALGLGRLRVGAHWPSDVLAGALIGAVWVAALAVALRGAEVMAERGRRTRRDPVPGPATRPPRRTEASRRG